MLWQTQKLGDSQAEQCPMPTGKENQHADATLLKAGDSKPKSVDSHSSSHHREPLAESMRDNLDRTVSDSKDVPERANPEKSVGKRESFFPFETYRFFGKGLNAALKETPSTKNASSPKDDQSQVATGESIAYTIDDFRNGFAKHIAKIKYFWRGTNFNYPYAFHRFYRISKKRRSESRLSALNRPKEEMDKDESQLNDSEGEEENEGDQFLLQEEYSNKLINPADKFYK
jgi:hypothetical protein